MKSFTERVKRDQEKQGLHVFRVPKGTIDLICMNNHGKTIFIRARGNGHGRLQQLTKLRLQVLGKKCGAKVLYSHVNGDNEIVFKIIYERK